MESLTDDYRVPRKPPLLALLESLQMHSCGLSTSTGEDMNADMLKRIDYAAKLYVGRIVDARDLANACSVSIDCGRRMLRGMERLGMARVARVGPGRKKFHIITRERK